MSEQKRKELILRAMGMSDLWSFADLQDEFMSIRGNGRKAWARFLKDVEEAEKSHVGRFLGDLRLRLLQQQVDASEQRREEDTIGSFFESRCRRIVNSAYRDTVESNQKGKKS